MKRASKWIVLAVALTLLFSMAVPAFAADSEKSTRKLMSLGIVEGDPSGELRLGDSITRAEFAKIAVMAAGLEDAATVLASAPSEFTDVKGNVWYTGWINVAAAQGLVKGDPSGTFRPNDNISGAEVVTVLLRLLGYNDNLPGSWPTDYIVKGAELKIMDGISFGASAAAVRGDVFAMADNTLDTEKVDWNSDKSKFEAVLDDDDNQVKLIADSFEGDMKSGLVTNVEWNSKGVLLATIDGAATATKVTDTVVVVGVPDVLALLGSKIDYVTNDDGEMVYAAAKDTSSVSDTELTIAADSVTIDDKTYDKVGTFAITNYPAGDTDTAVADYEADKIVVVFNKDGDAQWAFAYDFSSGDVIEEISGDRVFTEESTADFTYDEDDNVVVVKNGAIADFSALAVGDLIYVIDDREDLDNLVIASNQVTEGTLEDANSDYSKLTVGGTKYDVEDDGLVSNDSGKGYDDAFAATMFDKSMKLMLSPAGKVAVAIANIASAKSLYGIALEIDADIQGDRIRILTPDNKKTVYTVEDEDEDDDAEITGTLDAEDLIKYTLNDAGLLDSITVIEGGAKEKTLNDYSDNKVLVDGAPDVWNSIDGTVFFGQDSAGEWIATDWNSFKDVIDDGAVAVQTDINTSGVVKAVRLAAAVEDTDNVGVIAGSGNNTGGFYYDIIVKGQKVRYNTTADAAEDLAKKTFVTFTLDGSKISDIAAVAAGDLLVDGVEVETVGSDYLKVGGNYYYTTADTTVVDLTDTNPAVATKAARGDFVVIYGPDYADEGEVEVILIVDAD